MQRWIIRLLIITLSLLSAPWVNAQAGNTHGLPNVPELQSWYGDSTSPFIHTGCSPVTSGTLTLSAFACTSYVRPSGQPYLQYNTQSAVAVGPLSSGNGTYWVAIHVDTSTSIAGWTRQTGTKYLWQFNASKPAQPAGGSIFAQVTVAAGAVSAVSEHGLRRIVLSETITVNRTIDVSARWVVDGAQVTIANGVTVTHNGTVDAPCLSGSPWIVLQGTGLLNWGGKQALCAEWWGAFSDDSNAAATTLAINNAIWSLQGNKGVVRLGGGTYQVLGTTNGMALWAKYNNLTLQGIGPGSIIHTTVDTDTALCITPATNAGCMINVTTTISNILIQNIAFKGTSVAHYCALYCGKAILVSGYNNVSVDHITVDDMSTSGVEFDPGLAIDGAGNGTITNSTFRHIGLQAMNFNGRAYGGRIANNYAENIQGFAGISNCIQTGGSVVVIGNTCYQTGAFGILWSEALNDASGTITGNLIQGNAIAGINASFTGPVSITGNTVINGSTPGGNGGIWIQGGTSSGVAQHDSVVSGNFIENSYPYGIRVDADDIMVIGNHITWKASFIEPIANPAAMDYINVGTRPNGCISVFGARVQVSGNFGSNCVYGLLVSNSIATTFSAPGGNNWTGSTVAAFGYLNTAEGVTSTHEDIGTLPGGVRISRAGSAPTNGIWNAGDMLVSPTPLASTASGFFASFSLVTNTTANVVTTATALPVASVTGVLAGDVIVIYRDTNLATHATTVASIAGSTINLTAGMAFDTSSGSTVRIVRWHLATPAP